MLPAQVTFAQTALHRIDLWTTLAVSARERFPGEGITHNTVVQKYIASLSIRTELAAESAGIASSAEATYLPVEAHRGSAVGHSSDEAGFQMTNQIPATTTARGRVGTATSATNCSFLVEYANGNDQPPRRHCLASKADFKAFLDKHNDLYPRRAPTAQFPVEFDNWLVEDGTFVVSLKTGSPMHLAFWLSLLLTVISVP